MTRSEMLTMVGVMIEGDTNDPVILNAFLDMAGQKVLNARYPFGIPEDGEIPRQYHMKQCEIAAYLYARLGTNGQTTHDENGVKRVYEAADVPDSMLSEITPCVGGI